MSAYISEGYPYKLSSRAIKRDIEGFADEILKHRANVNFVNQYAPLIQLGQIELQERKNKRTNLYTFLISVLSLFVSCTALFVSYQSANSSSRWEQSQIGLLKDLKSELSQKEIESSQSAMSGSSYDFLKILIKSGGNGDNSANKSLQLTK